MYKHRRDICEQFRSEENIQLIRTPRKSIKHLCIPACYSLCTDSLCKLTAGGCYLTLTQTPAARKGFTPCLLTHKTPHFTAGYRRVHHSNLRVNREAQNHPMFVKYLTLHSRPLPGARLRPNCFLPLNPNMFRKNVSLRYGGGKKGRLMDGTRWREVEQKEGRGFKGEVKGARVEQANRNIYRMACRLDGGNALSFIIVLRS